MTTFRRPGPVLLAALLTAVAPAAAQAPAPAPAAAAHKAEQAAQKAKAGDTAAAAALYIEAARLAAHADDRADVARYDAEITRLRGDALPAWVAARRAAASAVPPAKNRAVMLWSRAHQQAVTAANANQLDQALDSAAQALSIARDNLGPRHIATIISATDLAALQLRAGKVEPAQANLSTALVAAAAALGPGHPETLKVRYALANLYQAQARYAEEADVDRAAAAAAAAGLGPDHPETITARLALARAEINAGQSAAATKELDATCPISRRVFGDWHVETSRCLMQQGMAALQQGDYPAAAQLLQQARAIQLVAAKDTDPLSLSTRIGQGEVEQDQGQLAEAQASLEGAVRDAAAAGDQANLWAARADLVKVLADRGDYPPAEALAKTVLDHDTAALGAGHPDTLAALTSLAEVYRKQGRLAEAEHAYDLAFEGYRKVLGESHPDTIIAANNLGEILEKEGIYDRAEPVMREALAGARKTFGDAHPTTLAAMNNLGLLYESQGVFDKAEPLYQSVVALLGKSAGPHNPETIASTNNLAYLYMLKGEDAKAAAMFQQVRDAWSKAYGPTHQNTLKALNNLARATQGEGHMAEAEKLFDQALAARRATLGPQHLDTLRSMRDLAALYLATGRARQAEQLLTKALAGDEATLGPVHPYTFETLDTLAATQESLGDLQAAYATRHTAFERRNAFFDRVLPVTGDNAREGYIRLHAPELAAYVALLTRLDESTAGRGVMEASLMRKGLLLKVASEIQQVTRLARDPKLTALADQLTETRKKLAALTLSGPTEATKGHHLEVVNGLEDRINDLQGELGRASLHFKQTVAPVTLASLEAALPDDAVLVDFLIYQDGGTEKMVAATLRKENGKAVYGLVKYPDLAAINAAVMKYRKDIQDEDIEFDDLMDSGQKTYDLVWKPLETAIGKRTKVYVVPDGTLNILPIAALVAKDGKYLIERVDLHVLGSSRDLLPSLIPPAKGGFLIDAGPDYNTESTGNKEQVEQAKKRSATTPLQSDIRGMASGLRGLHFDPLPGAEREGQLIYKTVEGGGEQTTMFTKAQAQEKVLHDMTAPPEVLHIATHGFFLKADDTLKKRLLALQRSSDFQVPPPGDNPLLRAGLAFAGINTNAPVLGEIDTDNDGVLTALEVLDLNLTGTRLAILSACETGLGEIHEGEGVYGLRRAFQEAGAQSVVSSLWEVSDAGTQTLMSALYKRLLAGQSPHEALREAQLEMLHDNQWSAPYIWSAFFMVGG